MFIILAGKDRTGKTTVAEEYKKQGYRVIHLNAPNKIYYKEGYSGPSYLDELMELYMSCNGQNVVFDRSPYCELVWSEVYKRPCLLNDEDLEILREIEERNEAKYIMMHDYNLEANWQRCVKNNEPVTKAQFILANKLYLDVAKRFNFKIESLKDLGLIQTQEAKVQLEPSKEAKPVVKTEKSSMMDNTKKLEVANAINDILSKRIIKQKSDAFDFIENSVREFLQNKLNSIFSPAQDINLSKEDILILKTVISRIKDKETR